jgi:capsular exopolysaccharide synthesis family protein
MRDYLFTLRRRAWIVVGIALVAALVAAGLAFLQTKSYTAQASVNATPPAQNAGLAGLLTTTQELPTTTAAALEQTITRPQVLTAVKKELNLSGSLTDIANNISTTTDTNSDFVLISGTASTAVGAQRFTDAVANAVVNLDNGSVQATYRGLAVQEQNQAQRLEAQFKGTNIARLNGAQLQAYQSALTSAQTYASNAARLGTFSSVVSVAQIEALATIPSSPDGPHLVLNVILGLVVGTVLGLLLVWLLESFDRRLRRPDEASSLLELPILGVVEKGGLGKTPAADSKNAPSISAFRMLRTNVRFLSPGSPPRAVLVTSSMSEEGKTTVAMGLALSSAAAGFNTLLIEGDVHRPAHARRLGLNNGPGLADYLSEGLSPDKVLQVRPFTEAFAGLSSNGSSNGKTSKLTCITAGNVTAFAGDALGSQRFADVINEVKQVYDMVVIDSAPLLAVAETSEMIAFADAVVFCVRMGKTTAEQARAAHAALARLPEKLAGLVITDLQRKVGGYYGYTYGDAYMPDKATLKEAAAS